MPDNSKQQLKALGEPWFISPNQAVDYDCDVCGLIGYECVHLRDFRLAMEAGRQERFQPCGYCGAGTARPICKGQCFEGRLAPNPCESCAGTGRIGSFRCKCSDTDGHLAPCGHPITSLRDMGEASGHYCHDCAVEKRDQRIACTTTKTCTCGHAQREHRERDNPPGPSWFSTCSKCACRSYKEDGLHDMSTTLARALLFAAIAHRGQADFHGIPYIEHVLAVVEGVSSHGPSVMTVAALHDVVEDTDWTRFEMEKMFGRTIANSVDDLTRRKGEVYMDYVRRAGKNPVSRIVKVADLNHNLDPRRKRVGRSEDRYRRALAYLEEMA